MKIRPGFVSNSSSSNFIIDSTIDEVKTDLGILLCFWNAFYNENLQFDDVFEVRIVDKKLIDDEDLPPSSLGKVNINSAMDNSIPSLMCELIEDKYDATTARWW